MKCRLKIGKLTKSASRYSSEIEILCKKIHTITINRITYYKNHYKESLEIQNFYRMIIKNVSDISYIKYGKFNGDNFTEYYEYYIQNNLLHNYAGPAYIRYSYNDIKNMYFIEGKIFSEIDWKTNVKRNIWLRKNKLERLIFTLDVFNEQN